MAVDLDPTMTTATEAVTMDPVASTSATTMMTCMEHFSGATVLNHPVAVMVMDPEAVSDHSEVATVAAEDPGEITGAEEEEAGGGVERGVVDVGAEM